MWECPPGRPGGHSHISIGHAPQQRLSGTLRRRRTSRPVRRVLLPPTVAGGGGDHPSWPAVAGGLTRPTRRLGRAALGRLLRGLAPGGVCRAAAVACGAGGLLPHRFTLTGRVARQAVCSLWHCPAGRPGWPLATALLCGARTFLDLPVPQEYRGRPVGSSAQCTLSSPEPARLLSGASCGSGNNYECDSVRRVHRAHQGRRARRISPPCAQE